MAKNRHKRHGRQRGEEIARNLIEYRAYLGDKEIPGVGQLSGYTIVEADEGEKIENLSGEKGRYAILEYGEDPCLNYDFVLYVSDSLSILRPIFEILCIENNKDLIKALGRTGYLILWRWKCKAIFEMDKSKRNQA